ARRVPVSLHSPSPTRIYPLSLHDALPIFDLGALADDVGHVHAPLLDDLVALDALQLHFLVGGDLLQFTRAHDALELDGDGAATVDRKSTRLNSSHVKISYAVFCLKKKKEN